MTTHVICAVLDLKAHYYARPFTARTQGEAIRIFTDAVNDKDTAFNAHPEDYALYALGQYDDQMGTILADSKPHLLIAGSAVDRR